MSHAKNKIDWCLKKAKKGDALHRGLVKTTPNVQLAQAHIIKAEHNYQALLTFEKTGFSDWSASAAFYTIYHCLLAIAAKQGYESRNQECTIALIRYLTQENLIQYPQEILDSLMYIQESRDDKLNIIALREKFQYGTKTEIEDARLESVKQLCLDALDCAKKVIHQ